MKPILQINYNLLKSVYNHRYMIWTMALRDIRSRYIGSYIGIFWSVIQPLVMIFIYWFVFSVGFKAKPAGNIPFLLWFSIALAAWMAFSEIISASAGSVIENSNLIKRTVFPSEVLPFAKLVSSLINHLIMLIIVLVLSVIKGIYPTIYWLQLLFFIPIMGFFALGLGYIFAALNVFIRDVGQALGVLLQFWFWSTPIFWDLKMIPEKYHIILNLNPMLYIVSGYRDSVFYGKVFWIQPELLGYFLGVSIFTFIIGTGIFHKLKRNFGDVL